MSRKERFSWENTYGYLFSSPHTRSVWGEKKNPSNYKTGIMKEELTFIQPKKPYKQTEKTKQTNQTTKTCHMHQLQPQHVQTYIFAYRTLLMFSVLRKLKPSLKSFFSSLVILYTLPMMVKTKIYCGEYQRKTLLLLQALFERSKK